MGSLSWLETYSSVLKFKYICILFFFIINKQHLQGYCKLSCWFGVQDQKRHATQLHFLTFWEDSRIVDWNYSFLIVTQGWCAKYAVKWPVFSLDNQQCNIKLIFRREINWCFNSLYQMHRERNNFSPKCFENIVWMLLQIFLEDLARLGQYNIIL